MLSQNWSSCMCVSFLCLWRRRWSGGDFGRAIITESRDPGEVRSHMVGAKKDHLLLSGLWHVFVCVSLYETGAHTESSLKNSEIPLGLFYLLFSTCNAKWGQRLQPEPSDCVQREDEGENKQKKGNKTDREAAGKKIGSVCPAAGTQTGWFGWGMVSQKHLREADSVTMATRRSDRQRVLSVLWLMPAARLALALASQTDTHIYTHTHTCMLCFVHLFKIYI